MRAWGQAFRIPTAGRGRSQASMGMSCQPIAGYEREMFSAGCTMNIGSKKLLREVASTFCGAQRDHDSRCEQLTRRRCRMRTNRRDEARDAGKYHCGGCGIFLDGLYSAVDGS